MFKTVVFWVMTPCVPSFAVANISNESAASFLPENGGFKLLQKRVTTY
jgi:hypothetical protein